MFLNQLKKPATIFVSETFDAALIGEKFLSILTHAKKEKIITADATVIPNSAVIFGQLLESTLSLRRDANNTPLLNLGKYNLEPMRKYRPSSVYTVRYLNEQNAVRRRLSDIVPLFEYDFQNYDLSSENFAYTCVIFKISEADEGVFDSIGLWFNLYLDKERELVLSNAPVSPDRTIHLAPCWMQAIYRVSKDVIVKRGDIVRIQIFQMPHNYVIGEVGNGLHNMNSRLIKLNAKNCRNAVEIYSFREDVYSEIQDPSFFQSNIYKNREYYVGAIPGGSKPGEETFAVFPAKVYQSFKIVAKLPSGKIMGMYYQLPDSQASLKASIRVKANTKLALDTYRITCPDE